MVKCNQCGYCCTRIVTKIRSEDEWILEYYKARGMEVKDGVIYIIGESRCPHLTEDNKCGIQDKKPTLCRMYPIGIRKEEMNDKCAFKQ